MYLIINPETFRVFQGTTGPLTFDSRQDAQEWCDENDEPDCLIVEFKCFS